MASTSKNEGLLDQEQRLEKQKSPLPWIQKYLEMADLLIRCGRFSPEHREEPEPPVHSKAVRTPK